MIRYMQIAILGALAVLLSVVASDSAQAQAFFSGVPNQQPTSALNLQGNVPAVLQVEVQSLNQTFDLTLNQSEVKAADVGARTNNNLGFTVTVESANATGASAPCSGPCFLSPTTSESLDFQVSKGTIGSGFLTFTSGEATWLDQNSKTLGTGIVEDLNIAYDGTGTFLSAATDYTETLTFTIVAK